VAPQSARLVLTPVWLARNPERASFQTRTERVTRSRLGGDCRRTLTRSSNPVNSGIAAGLLKEMGVEYEYPVILGRDDAGSSSRLAPRPAATRSAIRFSASSCTPTRPPVTAAGPS
jgi:hypothetical protein